MLYKFKSTASSDVIMLEPSGRQLLGIMGKGFDPKGILLPEQMAAAKAAILAAVALDEQTAAELADDKHSDQDATSQHARGSVNLRTRAWPLVTLIDHSLKANVPITWGV